MKVEDEQAATAQGEHRHCAVQETVDRVLKDLGNGFPIDFEPLTEEDDKVSCGRRIVLLLATVARCTVHYYGIVGIVMCDVFVLVTCIPLFRLSR